jgi:endonuclease I
MKKILVILILMLSLSGCAFLRRTTTTPPVTTTTTIPTTVTTEGVPVTLTFEANIAQADLTISRAAPFYAGDTLTLEAQAVEGYRFVHWIDVNSQLIIGRNPVYVFTLLASRTIQAIYYPENTSAIVLASNIDGITLTQPVDVAMDEPFTLSAPEQAGSVFRYWQDALTQEILSNDRSITFTPQAVHYLIAVYEVWTKVGLEYETGFEDVTKSAYAIASIETSERSWTLDDALIGSSDNDQKADLRSVRIRNGVLESDFSIKGLRRLQFGYGRYLSDSLSDISVYVSHNQAQWILLDEVQADGTWKTFDFEFTDLWYQSHTLEADTPLYVRIESLNAYRVNIDHIRLYRDFYHTPDLPDLFMSEGAHFPNDSERITIHFSQDFITHYSLNDVWEPSGCIATDVDSGDDVCLTYGQVDTSKPGYHEVIYYALDADGFYSSTVVRHGVFEDARLLEIDYTGYYDGIEGLHGEALVAALRGIIQHDIERKSYAEARQILQDADVHPDYDDKVLTIYSRDAVARVWDETSWHREHVWPNSRLGVPRVTNTERNIASDLHNLRAIVPSINSSRSNKVFTTSTTSDTYDPGILDQGDVARILFYMVIMYPELSLVNEILPNDPETNYTPEGAKMAVFNDLLLWHRVDEVDMFEHQRNEVIYQNQNNRNPFIDHPHLVALIWMDAYDRAFDRDQP